MPIFSPPLIIAGMHRSGTSVLTSALFNSGLIVGSKLLGGDIGNPDGHYEDTDFLSLNIDILRSQGFNIEGFVAEQIIQVPNSIIPRVHEIVKQKQALLSDGQFWGWKEPRTTLFLNFWKQQLPNAKVLAVYRSPWDVADSLYRRGDPCFQYNPRFAIEVWSNYNRRIVDFYNNYPKDTVVVSIENALKNYGVLVDILNKKFNINLGYFDINKIYKPNLLYENSTDSLYPEIVRFYHPKAIEIYQELIAIDSLSELSNSRIVLEGGSVFNLLSTKDYGDIVFQSWYAFRRLESEKQNTEKRLQSEIQSYQSEMNLKQEDFEKILIERDKQLNALELQIRDLSLELKFSQDQSKILALLNQLSSRFEEIQSNQYHLQCSISNIHTYKSCSHNNKEELATGVSNDSKQNHQGNLLNINLKIQDSWSHFKCRINSINDKLIKFFLLVQKVFWWGVTLQFSEKLRRRKIARLISNSGLFDTGYYWKQTGNDSAAQADPLGHYLDFGAEKLLNPHPLFSTRFYLESYPEVREENINPLAHYLLIGAQKGYNPHPLFDTAYYLNEYPDVLDSGVNPLYHYSQLGINQNRNPFKCAQIAINFPYISRDISVSIDEIPKSSSPDYQKWLEHHYPLPMDLAAMKVQVNNFDYQPLISIIMPIYNTHEVYLREAIDSVLNQIYAKWELCIADDCSTESHIIEVLEEYKEKDRRIKVVYRQENGHISAASNSALSLATGEFIVLLDHDDLLTPHALFRVVELLNKDSNADMIYSDEDKINDDNILSDAAFKPDWSPDSFLSRMYTCHLGVYRRSIIEEIQGFRVGYEGAQDYDLVLRFTEKTDKIFHIPDILYHWRIHPQSTAGNLNSKTYATFAAKKAIADALERRGEPGRVTDAPFYPGYHIVRYEIKSNDLVSIIIPTRDMGSTLEVCLKSVFEKSTYPNFEVIVIDNGSTESLVKRVFDKWSSRQLGNFQVIHLDIPFNFSKLNNYAVEHAKGEYLLFLNNDIEVITPDWIECMVEQAQRPSIGAVGNLLLYPDNTIQHAGVVNGIVYCCSHTHKGFRIGEPGYLNYINTVNNYSAVTGASLMCRRSVFDEVGGFDEKLAVNFNDIDLCLKMLEKGYRNIYLPHARLYHYESKSRGFDLANQNRKARLYCEAKYFQSRWKVIIEHDPCYNPNLTIEHEDFRIRYK